MLNKREEDQQALFGQVKIEATEKLDIVLAGRYDESSLHDAQESPKAAVVYKFNPNHTLRFTYNEAFQTPNYSEYFLLSPSADVVPFGALQDGVSAAFGINLRTPPGEQPQPSDLNWANLNLVAVGNENLVPEQIESYELGYKGIINGNLYLTADIYQSTITNFVTDLLTGVNGNLPGFEISEEIPGLVRNTLIQQLQAALGPAAAGLSNLTDATRPSALAQAGVPLGHPVLLASYTNAGEVETEGFEIAFNYYLNEEWTIDGNYSFFDFDIIDQQVGDELIPNSSENKYNIGFTYDNGAARVSANYKFVEGFPFAAGVFQGDVPDYNILDLDGSYRFNEQWQFLLSISNALDEDHYQIFGGSVLGERWLFSLNYGF